MNQLTAKGMALQQAGIVPLSSNLENMADLVDDAIQLEGLL